MLLIYERQRTKTSCLNCRLLTPIFFFSSLNYSSCWGESMICKSEPTGPMICLYCISWPLCIRYRTFFRCQMMISCHLHSSSRKTVRCCDSPCSRESNASSYHRVSRLIAFTFWIKMAKSPITWLNVLLPLPKRSCLSKVSVCLLVCQQDYREIPVKFGWRMSLGPE